MKTKSLAEAARSINLVDYKVEHEKYVVMLADYASAKQQKTRLAKKRCIDDCVKQQIEQDAKDEADDDY